MYLSYVFIRFKECLTYFFLAVKIGSNSFVYSYIIIDIKSAKKIAIQDMWDMNLHVDILNSYNVMLLESTALHFLLILLEKIPEETEVSIIL